MNNIEGPLNPRQLARSRSLVTMIEQAEIAIERGKTVDQIYGYASHYHQHVKVSTESRIHPVFKIRIERQAPFKWTKPVAREAIRHMMTNYPDLLALLPSGALGQAARSILIDRVNKLIELTYPQFVDGPSVVEVSVSKGPMTPKELAALLDDYDQTRAAASVSELKIQAGVSTEKIGALARETGSDEPWSNALARAVILRELTNYRELLSRFRYGHPVIRRRLEALVVETYPKFAPGMTEVRLKAAATVQSTQQPIRARTHRLARVRPQRTRRVSASREHLYSRNGSGLGT